ncbi:MAG: L-rhamnose isomerase [Candidatus Latescibacterota bacterium]
MSNTLGAQIDKGLDYLKASFGEAQVEWAIDSTGKFAVEVPGWQVWNGFGGGGRFDAGGSGGVARTTLEIAEDVGVIHALTRSTPQISQHILWFLSRDGHEGDFETAVRVKKELEANGVSMGSINPTYFLAGSEDGSFTAQNPAVRKRYVDQTVLSAKIAAELGNGIVAIWFPDGTNYPGQRHLQDKISLMKESILEFWSLVSPAIRKKLDRILFEYKVFEPGTYSTTIPDWGTACELARLVGDQGGVQVDMGHHSLGVNIEQIVGTMIVFGIRGGFHFNTRYAADDDHSVQADYPLACIFNELFKGDAVFNADPAKNWCFALDQMARTEKRIPSVLKSVDALKRSVAKAALVDYSTLESQQRRCDLIDSNIEFEKALLHADTAPIVMESYRRKGLHPIPMAAYYESGYQEKIERERA